MKTVIERAESFLEWGGVKRDITLLVISGIALVISIFKLSPLPFDASWIAIILCGIPIILEAVIGLVTAFDIKADVLVSIALIASLIIGEDFAAGEVAFIMQLGALLEDLTVARARAGIEKLLHLTPQTARVIRDGKETVISAESVKLGETLRILPGETIPVDGTVIAGQTSVNQAVMTGESLPVDKSVGYTVLSGTVNQFGSFDMEATKVGEDSSIRRMVRLVQSADAAKAKIVGIADRWATWIVVIALSAAVLTWLVTKEPIRAVTILVVFCPCALVLATPTAIMAAIGNVTKHGFLVREGDALERLAQIKRITFDKTGTLTYGTPEVMEVSAFREDIDESELLQLTARAEMLSEHPIGKAIVRKAKKMLEKENSFIDIEKPEDFKMLPGRGVSAAIDGKTVLAGNLELLLEHGITLPKASEGKANAYLEKGGTVIYVAWEDRFAGLIALSDVLRENVRDMLREIRQLDIIPVLLTGDNEQAANTIAGQLDITEVRSACLPEDKLAYIERSGQEQLPVCMIGDGINDAPALKAALVGIAMGGVGSDIAVDAADIALVNDDIKELPHLLQLSKHMMTVIRFNLTFSMALNFIAIILAMTGILNPVVGALVHNAGSVFVIVNSAFLLRWKKR